MGDLCSALHFNASKRIIERLFYSKCPTDVCSEHGSVLHCAVDFSKSGIFNLDILQLLIDKGANVRAKSQPKQKVSDRYFARKIMNLSRPEARI